MSKNNKSVVWLIITVVWMTVIFCFSAQPADVSTDTSLRVGMTIGKMSVPDFSKLPKEEQIDYAKKIEFPVRKMAHATEYAILGCLLTNLCQSLSMKRAYMWSWLMGSAYAATDEFHQLFVPGRSGQITDVMLEIVEFKPFAFTNNFLFTNCGSNAKALGLKKQVLTPINKIKTYKV